MNTRTNYPAGIEFRGPVSTEFERILTPEAMAFLDELHRQFQSRRKQLLEQRVIRQRELDAGKLPDFLEETRNIRESDWKIAPIPRDLEDRRVEITGPTDRKMVINALNSGAKVFMADFEDSNSPTWDNMVRGQLNLADAVQRTIDFTSPEGKEYRLNQEIATLMVRPRGWHLDEKHLVIDGEPMSGSLFDFGLYFFHNAKHLLSRGTGPYFYLPKLESHLEARLWNDVFVMAQRILGVPVGSIKATVLIETILAAFEMDEILYELREHSAGLNCGRWDYIFSCIKKFRNRKDFAFADRSHITMTSPFMRAYSLLLIQTCHRRGAHAMGGMAAQIPIKNDAKANEQALEKVRQDKLREARDGHDGTWVAHPGLVPIAMEIFKREMPEANQLHCQRDDVIITAAELLDFGPETPITEEGLRINIRIGLQYLASWLSGMGCVPILNLMEDAATAEISRSQIWQWIRSTKGVLQDGRKVTSGLFEDLFAQELASYHDTSHGGVLDDSMKKAAKLFERLIADDQFEEFLTLKGYEALVQEERIPVSI